MICSNFDPSTCTTLVPRILLLSRFYSAFIALCSTLSVSVLLCSAILFQLNSPSVPLLFPHSLSRFPHLPDLSHNSQPPDPFHIFQPDLFPHPFFCPAPDTHPTRSRIIQPDLKCIPSILTSLSPAWLSCPLNWSVALTGPSVSGTCCHPLLRLPPR